MNNKDKYTNRCTAVGAISSLIMSGARVQYSDDRIVIRPKDIDSDDWRFALKSLGQIPTKSEPKDVNKKCGDSCKCKGKEDGTSSVDAFEQLRKLVEGDLRHYESKTRHPSSNGCFREIKDNDRDIDGNDSAKGRYRIFSVDGNGDKFERTYDIPDDLLDEFIDYISRLG